MHLQKSHAPDNDPILIQGDGSINWSKVTAVYIVFIGDYYDDATVMPSSWCSAGFSTIN
jgi:hypothetical protein